MANLVKTDGRYSLAIEIALGAGLQNIVVDREEDAKAAISYLKQRDAGRATFLPLTAIRGDELHEKGVEKEFGFVGLGSRLVTFDPAYRNIVYNLLGRTVVVEDLDCGIAMARKYRNAFRIVTLDGQVINRGGSMTGGSTSRSAGVLSRSAELEQLTARTAAMQAKLAEAKQAEEDTARELAAAQYELETAEAQRRHAEDEVLRLEGIRGQYDLLLRSLEESVENLAGELESLAGRLTDNDARSAAAQVEINRQESAAADARPRQRRLFPANRSCWRNPVPWPRRSAAERAIWLPWRPSGRPQSAAPRTCGRCARISLVTGSRRNRWRRPTAETSPPRRKRSPDCRRRWRSWRAGARPSGSGWPPSQRRRTPRRRSGLPRTGRARR